MSTSNVSCDEACDPETANQSHTPVNLFDSQLEEDCMANVIFSYLHFYRYGKLHLYKSFHSLRCLPNHHREFLQPSITDCMTKFKHSLRETSRVLSLIALSALTIFDDDKMDCERIVKQSKQFYTERKDVPESSMDRVKAVLHQIVREWTAAGAEDRNIAFNLIKSALFSRYSNFHDRSDIKVLIPGAGLARLAWELVNEGFSAVCYEFSYQMLLVSNFILNHRFKEKYKIHPHLFESCNTWSYADRLQSFEFPDVDPSFLNKGASTFEMNAAEFVEGMRTRSDKFPVVITVFFLDTSKNILEYVDCIYSVLQNGGTWINFGPLMYHHSSSSSPNLAELPYDLLLEYVVKLGFRIDADVRNGLGTNYVINNSSMRQMSYNCAYLICTKI